MHLNRVYVSNTEMCLSLTGKQMHSKISTKDGNILTISPLTVFTVAWLPLSVVDWIVCVCVCVHVHLCVVMHVCTGERKAWAFPLCFRGK